MKHVEHQLTAWLKVASPGQAVGCGLKRLMIGCGQRVHEASPGQAVGCGLKLVKFESETVRC